jgi:prefoldin subunit 5
MTEAQIQDIYSRLDSLTSEVNSLKLLTGTIGTSQVAIAQILNTQQEHTQILNGHTQLLNSHTRLLNSHTADLTQLKSDVGEILRILRDRNGGSGL